MTDHNYEGTEWEMVGDHDEPGTRCELDERPYAIVINGTVYHWSNDNPIITYDEMVGLHWSHGKAPSAVSRAGNGPSPRIGA